MRPRQKMRKIMNKNKESRQRNDQRKEHYNELQITVYTRAHKNNPCFKQLVCSIKLVLQTLPAHMYYILHIENCMHAPCARFRWR